MTDEVEDIDADLVRAVRAGDREAFVQLYRRNFAHAYGLACKLIGTSQGADDLVSDAFVKVFNRIVAGGGPTEAFRAYLLTTVRTTFYKQVARDRMFDRRVEVTELLLPAEENDPVTEGLDAQLASRALDSLPVRWRSVLVLLELDRLSTSAVADVLGMRPNAVAALAFRAREGLRLAYVQMHVKAAAEETCREAVGNLAALLAGRKGRTVRQRVRDHLALCDNCTGAAREVTDLLAQLGRSVPPDDRLVA
ncbi:RNA polymerase sigma factor [Lentzea nigeriaca]|uniref:RNA polymerase sigma factor n=1 Tax=Lentzea nigeriaca TaxID=1128665 RepID=UPI00195E89E3|nr:RNA polymerase sigma factor [Lentzea nigeriaca]MBM7859170.1 RNA polymerase sigma factor (sigma-70 family) [Lentzea nigeriaca]